MTTPSSWLTGDSVAPGLQAFKTAGWDFLIRLGRSLPTPHKLLAEAHSRKRLRRRRVVIPQRRPMAAA